MALNYQDITCKTTSGAVLVKDVELLIDVDPCGTTPVFAPFAAGITDLSDESEENVEETQYFPGTFTDVTSAKMAAKVSGHRFPGDLAQDYVEQIQPYYGNPRFVTAKLIKPWGVTYTGEAVVSDIISFGGAATERNTFECKITWNGQPTVSYEFEGMEPILLDVPMPYFDPNKRTVTFEYESDPPSIPAFQAKYNLIAEDSSGLRVVATTLKVETLAGKSTFIMTLMESLTGTTALTLSCPGIPASGITFYDDAVFKLM